MSSNLHKRVLQGGTGAGMLPPRPPPSAVAGQHHRGGAGHKRDYSPLEWSNYFAKKEFVETEGGKNRFAVYTAEGPADSEDSGPKPVLVLLHGGGFSALTWSLFAADVVKKVSVTVLALDLRGHGDTVTDNDLDLSAHTMAKDVVDVLAVILGERREKKEEEDEQQDGIRPEGDHIGHIGRQVVLIGHSMGGALAVHAALTGKVDNLLGLCVIDVVEGTAMDALSSMPTFLRSRPSKFNSLEFAIEWSVRSGQVRNPESARVSMPGQLKSLKTNYCATHDVGKDNVSSPKIGVDHAKADFADTIAEEDEEEQSVPVANDAVKAPQSGNSSNNSFPGYTWRIDLAGTEQHWPGWFKDLSSKFLSVDASKLLVLAGVDRLDRELTVGQMQGKFQMQVLPQAGHAVHEDAPDKVADVVATFLVRNKFAKARDMFNRTFPAC